MELLDLNGMKSDPNSRFPNLNMVRSLMSPSYLNLPKKTIMGLSSSREVLQLVASCVAPGPHLSSSSGMTSFSFLENNLPLPNSINHVGFLDSQSSMEKNNDLQNLLSDAQVMVPENKLNRPDSDNSSKTYSDPYQTEQYYAEEISLEGTLSDDPMSEHEA